MNYFENIIKTLLEFEGYWVRQSFKVNLTREEKRRIGKPTMPRPEIDLLAFRPNENEIIAMEAKSYLDSSGVQLASLRHDYDVPTGSYKLFTCANYRKIVFRRLKADLVKLKLTDKKVKISLGLAAGNVHRDRSNEIRELIESKGWVFWSPTEISEKINKLANQGYENDPAIITAKILSRNST